MAKQIIDLGTANNPATGDTIRVGGQKVNDNFTEVYDDSVAKQAQIDLNTAKVGITAQQSADITANNAKVSNVAHPLVEKAVPAGAVFTDTLYDDTAIQAAVSLNTAKVTFPEAPNDAKQYARQSLGWAEVVGGGGGITDAPSDGSEYVRKDAAWVVNTDEDTIYDDTAIQAAVSLNTAKVGITAQQASDITANNAKISYTDAAAVAANTSKVSFPEAPIDTKQYARVDGAWAEVAGGGGGGGSDVVHRSVFYLDSSDITKYTAQFARPTMTNEWDWNTGQDKSTTGVAVINTQNYMATVIAYEDMTISEINLHCGHTSTFIDRAALVRIERNQSTVVAVDSIWSGDVTWTPGSTGGQVFNVGIGSLTNNVMTKGMTALLMLGATSTTDVHNIGVEIKKVV